MKSIEMTSGIFPMSGAQGGLLLWKPFCKL